MPLFLKLTFKLLRLNHSLIVLLTLLLVLVSSTLAFLLEPDTFGSWFNALWWVMTTVATVGYGDYYPATVPGKVLAMLLYVFGIGLLSLLIGKIIDSLAELQRRREGGKLKFQGAGHVIVINWSKKAQLAVEELLASEAALAVVVVDDGAKHPFDHPRVHFVSGDPSSAEALEQAGIHHARSAIIFADPRIDDSSLVDGKSLLIASSIERAAPAVHTTVEIVLEKHILNFRHVQVNDFILSHDAVSRLAVRSALKEGSADLFTQLLSRTYGEDVFEVPADPAWVTYGDAFRSLLGMGATLIADRTDMGINRKLESPIPSDARLFVITDGETITKIRSERR
ncbi:potassium channel protein [Paenibacillus arenilitoris]|uniref:Ion transporter n=1 Tax=Paenibacillus arenilitoris TaxID=2772299 RepID=A0A927CJV0_9BACL|nr:potassium channel family protein [Paenibacillus arenilitoris]MBD2867516.1 ion transporter [Paenibacillus arenilitoris]